VGTAAGQSNEGTGRFTLASGTVLNILVDQTGQAAGPGGGGSFVATGVSGLAFETASGQCPASVSLYFKASELYHLPKTEPCGSFASVRSAGKSR
jgi:hypothetical protein